MNFLEWCKDNRITLIISAVAVAVVIIFIFIIVLAHKSKKNSEKGKIYKTTDGKLSNRPHINKGRRVAVVAQRKDDGAVALVKIYSQKDKDGTAYIANLVLTPEEHKSLTENSIVGSQVIIGIKQNDGSIKPIFTRELDETDDELTKDELKAIKNGVHNDTPQHRNTYKNKMRRWRKHFRK